MKPVNAKIPAKKMESLQCTRGDTRHLWHCPRCGAAMIVVQRFTAELSRFAYFDSS
jgi:hypothetical protein